MAKKIFGGAMKTLIRKLKSCFLLLMSDEYFVISTKKINNDKIKYYYDQNTSRNIFYHFVSKVLNKINPQ